MEWLDNAMEELQTLSTDDREEYMAGAIQLLWAHVQMKKPDKPIEKITISLDPDGSIRLVGQIK